MGSKYCINPNIPCSSSIGYDASLCAEIRGPNLAFGDGDCAVMAHVVKSAAIYKEPIHIMYWYVCTCM